MTRGCAALLLGRLPRLNWLQSNPPSATVLAEPIHSAEKVRQAWVPWLLLSLLVFLWGVPAIKKSLDNFSAPAFPVAGLHNVVQRMPPVVGKASPYAAVYNFTWLSASGTACLLAVFLGNSFDEGHGSFARLVVG